MLCEGVKNVMPVHVTVEKASDGKWTLRDGMGVEVSLTFAAPLTRPAARLGFFKVWVAP